jgi:hypothetical protein
MQGLKSRIPNRVPIAFFPKAEALTPGFVKILGHVCGAGAPTKPAFRRIVDNVAKIWCCSQW